MSDTLSNISIPANEWVDLYALSGISVGEKLSIENVGVYDIRLSVSENKPSLSNDSYSVLTRKNGVRLQNSKGDKGAWAYCHGVGKVNINKVSSQGVGFYPESASSSNFNNGIGSGIVLDAWGVQKVSLPISLFHGLWTFDIPQSMWFMFENGIQVYSSTAIASVNSAARLLTNVTETDLILESRECPRYQPNRGHLFSTALWCPNKANDCERNFGMGTDENGVVFRLKSDGLLYAVMVSGGSQVRESVIDTSGMSDFDVEKGNVYDIQYQWRGVGNYLFFINLQLVHTFSLLGTLTELSMENPALPIHFHIKRITEDAEMHIGCADVTSENGIVDKEVYTSAYAEDVSVNGDDSPCIVVRQPLLIGGKTNTRTITLARISVTCTKKATFKVWMVRDATAITGATYKPVNAGSFVETDSVDMDAAAVRATSVTTSSMRFVTAIPVEAAVSRSVDNPYRGRIEFPIVRGDFLVITCTAVSAESDVTVEWGEQV